MGSKLCCVSKNPTDENGKPKAKKNKKQKKDKNEDLIEATVAGQENAAAPDVPVPIVYLERAPSNYNLPTIIPVVVKDKQGVYSPPITADSQKNATQIGAMGHKEQPVDTQARQLAQANAKPSCWTDLHWNLIGSRNLRTDEDKVRALFTWLCSKRPEDLAFPVEVVDNGTIDAKKKKHKETADSPDVVLAKLAAGKANYVQAFESMCRYSNIPCVTVRGIAKSMDYKVGQALIPPGEPLFHPETKALAPQIASLQHSWNAAYVDGKWRLFDCTWAAQRLAVGLDNGSAKAMTAIILQYETDMFYYMVDPSELIYTHYPFEDEWQLIEPPVSIMTFAKWPLLKPAFFQYGLSLVSHREGFIPAETKLIFKLGMHEDQTNKLMFSYQLNLEGFGNIDAGTTKTRYGMHEVSQLESNVIFHFRLPKKGEYNLVIYARTSGEQLLSDVCEYRVTSKGSEIEDDLAILPFPPTAQASYGPTEKAFELGLETLPRQLHPLIKSPKGSVELRFVASEPENKIPRLTARLKSLTVKPDRLEDCVLLREIEATLPTTGVSILTGMGPCIPMSVLNAYLPEVGEYALEVYAAPNTSEDPTSYHLAWQFLIEAEKSKPLSDGLRSRLATINLGPSDETWQQLGFRCLSHPDPVIRVRTAGWAGTSTRILKATSKSEVIQRYMEASSSTKADETGENLAASDAASDAAPVQENGNVRETGEEEEDEKIDPEAADVTIVLGVSDQQKNCLISQLVDISGDEEDDVTGYLLQKTQSTDSEDDLIGDRSSKVSADMAPSQVITLLVRIPRGGAFYKLYLYAVRRDENIFGSIPLVYTYLIDAPLRLTAAEAPYIGARMGEFPEKIAKRQQAENQQAANEPTAVE